MSKTRFQIITRFNEHRPHEAWVNSILTFITGALGKISGQWLCGHSSSKDSHLNQPGKPKPAAVRSRQKDQRTMPKLLNSCQEAELLWRLERAQELKGLELSMGRLNYSASLPHLSIEGKVYWVLKKQREQDEN
jgi:hypothetical protein